MKAPILKDIETFIYMIVIITVFHLSNLTQQIVALRFVSERFAFITRQLDNILHVIHLLTEQFGKTLRINSVVTVEECVLDFCVKIILKNIIVP